MGQVLECPKPVPGKIHPCWGYNPCDNCKNKFRKAPVKENETKSDDGCRDLLGVVQEPAALVI